jgi:hypothetical protein
MSGERAERAGSRSSAVRSVKPMPSPPIRHRGVSSVRARAQPNAASASSEPCIRLDINVWPPARITYSVE